MNGWNPHVHVENILDMCDTKTCDTDTFDEAFLLGINASAVAFFTSLRAANGAVDGDQI